MFFIDFVSIFCIQIKTVPVHFTKSRFGWGVLRILKNWNDLGTFDKRNFWLYIKYINLNEKFDYFVQMAFSQWTLTPGSVNIKVPTFILRKKKRYFIVNKYICFLTVNLFVLCLWLRASYVNAHCERTIREIYHIDSNKICGCDKLKSFFLSRLSILKFRLAKTKKIVSSS